MRICTEDPSPQRRMYTLWPWQGGTVNVAHIIWLGVSVTCTYMIGCPVHNMYGCVSGLSVCKHKIHVWLGVWFISVQA